MELEAEDSMATEHQTLEALEENSSDPRHRLALQRGDELLRMLHHAARAARLESEAVQLESALTQARRGDLRQLHQWLDNYDRDQRDQGDPCNDRSAVDDSPTQSGEAGRSALLTVSSAIVLAPVESHGWESYAAHARRRLQARGVQWHAVQNPSVIGDAQPFIVAPRSEHAPLEREEPWHAGIHSDVDHDEVNQREVTQLEDNQQTEWLDDELTGVAVDGADEGWDQPLSSECLAGLGEVVDRETKSALAQPTLRQRLFSCYGLSMAGHVIALVIMGTITYRAPADGNSLGSQVLTAAEARSDTELSTQVELLEPAELAISQPELTASAPASLASELSQLSQAVSPVSVEVPATASVGSAIASAITEASGKSVAGAVGSGVPSSSGKFFGVGTGGNYFCYVVDRSGSMRGGAWESAKNELVRSLKSLKATQKFYIVFFADEFEALPEPGRDEPATTGLYATPENIEHARRWIQSVQLNRGGPPNEALAWAIHREPDAIYLLTDGVTKVDVCAFLRKQNRTDDIVSGPQVRVPIHAIAYFSLDGQQLMRQLAKENGGQFIYVPKPKK